ncbi:glycosyltransferase [Sphingomonas nostoxanthinifaciens]|uniref:glycosyltransferase n=1 Tax=Sphingomonas nostoxanthinifaciens TaxID=2872652 RepID=UPI001CC1EF37|nr:glycosyltransferase [Sphingomonas nostoxanthinifaciens]UAK24134.1 glycosyltransferase [Sphingomonas nostoxanthinifaciens]
MPMYWSGETAFAARRPSADHIVLVLHDFGGGGSERIAIRLANAWVDAGRRVSLYCGAEDGPLRRLVSPRISMTSIAPGGTRRAGRRELGRALAASVRADRPDIVVGPGNYHVPILRAMIDDLAWDRPAVACKLSNPLVRGDRPRLAQVLFTANFRRVTAPFDTLVAMSPALAAEATVLLHRHDIACVHEPNLDAVPAPALDRPGTGMILCVGRLTRQKNFGLALDAFARADPSLRLVLLGQGEEEAMLKARAQTLGIAERITFAGFVHDVPRYLAQADVLLCTSLFEGYPAALVEALAAGVPVVSTPCSLALPEILLDRSFGAIARPRADEVARALTAVLHERRRPEAASLAELGRRHQLAGSARDWLAVLDDAVAARAAVMVAA